MIRNYFQKNANFCLLILPLHLLVAKPSLISAANYDQFDTRIIANQSLDDSDAASEQNNEHWRNLYLIFGGAKVQFSNESLIQEPLADSFVGVGYQLNEHWAVESTYLNSVFTKSSQAEQQFRLLNFDTIYRFSPRITNSWLVQIGISQSQYQNQYQGSELLAEQKTITNIGAGYDWSINQNLSVSIKGKYNIQSNKHGANFISELQLQYFFGGAESSARNNYVGAKSKTSFQPTHENSSNPTTALSPADNDRDGVNDDNDLCSNTPMHHMVDDSGCPIFEINRESITLDIQFPVNSSKVNSRYLEQIRSLARFMTNHLNLSVTIEGHTDNQGNPAYNLLLSKQRALAVANILIKHFHIPESRISTEGYGDTLPVGTNKTEKGRFKNRRVHAKLLVESLIPKLQPTN